MVTPEQEFQTIYIEPVIIPKKIIKEDDDSKILEKLKLASEKVLKKLELSEEEEANEVLGKLKEFEKKQEQVLNKGKEAERKRVLAKKREAERKRVLAKKREAERERVLAKKREAEIERVLVKNKECEERIKIELGVQNDLHTLSSREEDFFKHLEVVSQSEPFVLEGVSEIKNPQKYNQVEKEIILEQLPLVKSLGIVAVSKPFVRN
jgi:hypothetical protein